MFETMLPPLCRPWLFVVLVVLVIYILTTTAANLFLPVLAAPLL
jgi:hypothetical protein